MRMNMGEWKETPSVPLLRGRSACRGLEGAGLGIYNAAKLGCDETGGKRRGMRAAIDGCNETRGNKRQTRGDARVNYTSSFFILL